jgi:histidine phosphotransfer protein HptB
MNSSSLIDYAIFHQLRDTMGSEYIIELIHIYCEDVPQRIIEIKQAIFDRNSEIYRRAAHSIKSSSNILGALQLGTLANELEIIGREHEISTTMPKVEYLAEIYEIVKQELEEFCND